MIDFKDLMQRAQTMQQQMSQEMSQLAIEATSGGGAVRVIVNGNKEVTKLDIREDAVKDPEMLADLIQAALNRAYADVADQLQQRMSSMMGGIDPSMISKLFGS